MYYRAMKITIKGQVTIPRAMRERFGLYPGTEVEFVRDRAGLRVRPRLREEDEDVFDKWLAKAAGSADTKMTTEECMELTRRDD